MSVETDPGKQGSKKNGNILTSGLSRINRFLGRDVWDVDLSRIPTFRAIGVRLARVIYLAFRGLTKNNCLDQASALTYITVLSLVPMLALGFSVAKGFGAYDHLVENTIQPFLDSTFGSLDPAEEGELAAATDGEETAAAAGGEEGVGTGPDEGTGAGAGAGAEGETNEGAGTEDGAEAGAGEEGDGGEGASELRMAVEKLLSFVSRTNFSNLGILGLAFLMFAAIKLLTSIERVFNRIWGVERSRSFVRKVTDYVALVVITPILLITSTAVTGAIQSNRFVEYLAEDLHMGPLITIGFKMIPLVALWLGFGFLYIGMPNTRVPVISGLIGGVVGGTLWQLVQIMHVEFQVGVANYNAIYAGFAAFPIFLVWVYMGWVTVLLGAQAAWAHQAEPEYRELMRDAPETVSDREILAVHATVAVATTFARGKGVHTANSLAARFAVPPRAISEALNPLVEQGLLARTNGERVAGFLPARQLDQVRLQDVLESVRGGEGHSEMDQTEVDRVLAAYKQDAEKSAHNLTLAELVERAGDEELAGFEPGDEERDETAGVAVI